MSGETSMRKAIYKVSSPTKIFNLPCVFLLGHGDSKNEQGRAGGQAGSLLTMALTSLESREVSFPEVVPSKNATSCRTKKVNRTVRPARVSTLVTPHSVHNG